MTDPRDVIRRAHEAVQRVDAANRERALNASCAAPPMTLTASSQAGCGLVDL